MRTRIYRLVFVLAFAALTSLGCSSTIGSANPDGASSGDDGNSPRAECRGTLAEVGQGCPATFDGAPENVPRCMGFGAQQVWLCTNVIALSLGTGAFSVDCYYDGSSHSLVGAMQVNDTATLCGDSFTKAAGEIPPLACRFPVTMPTFYRTCAGNLTADAGAD